MKPEWVCQGCIEKYKQPGDKDYEIKTIANNFEQPCFVCGTKENARSFDLTTYANVLRSRSAETESGIEIEPSYFMIVGDWAGGCGQVGLVFHGQSCSSVKVDSWPRVSANVQMATEVAARLVKAMADWYGDGDLNENAEKRKRLLKQAAELLAEADKVGW